MNKNDIIYDFLQMILCSWSYNKLTNEEKTKLCDLLYSSRIKNTLKGTYKQRWEILNSIYYSFLIGLGYSPINWRD